MSSEFDVKSARVNVLALMLKTTDEEAIVAQALRHFSKVPEGTKNIPFVLDVHALDDPYALCLDTLLPKLRQQGIHIMGLRHTDKDCADFAVQHGLSFVPVGSRELQRDLQAACEEEEQEEVALKEDEHEEKTRPTLFMDKPIRSGQQVYAEQSDLVVTSSVSEGAEIIADGNIHVYASMRGRALAGASGNTATRIFIQDMQAQLVSVAGIYRTFEQKLPPSLYRKPVCIFLTDKRLAIQALDGKVVVY